jgi:hypothetical protein
MTQYRLLCQNFRRFVRVKVQRNVGGHWSTTGIEQMHLLFFAGWRMELQQWADERGITLVWTGNAVTAKVRLPSCARP